jgi:hypothetical protein
MRSLALVAVLLAAACGKAPPPPPPASKQPPAFPPPADLKPSDDFSKDGFLELPPAEAVALRWDLSERKIHTYLYEHESNLTRTTRSDKESNEARYRTLWKGAVKIVGGGERGSVYALMTPIRQWVNDTPISSEELNKMERTTVEYQLTSAGKFGSRRYESGAEDALVDLFFALPSRPLAENEQETRDVNIADLVEKSQRQYHGRQEIRNAGRRKVGRHECVKLLSKLDLELVPRVPSAEGRGRLAGAIAAYFDPRERRMIQVDVALAMAVDVRYEVRPSDSAIEPYWLLNRVHATLKATIKLDE